MNEYVEIEYQHNDTEEYVMDILNLGLCDLFLKAGMVREEETYKVSYQAEGYRPLTSFTSLRTEEALSVLLAVLRGIHQCEKRYVFADLFEIEPECIFVDKKISETKMIFVPAQGKLPLSEKAETLLSYLKGKCSEEGAGYMDKAIDLIKSGQYGYKSLLHLLEQLRREVYLCGVE